MFTFFSHFSVIFQGIFIQNHYLSASKNPPPSPKFHIPNPACFLRILFYPCLQRIKSTVRKTTPTYPWNLPKTHSTSCWWRQSFHILIFWGTWESWSIFFGENAKVLQDRIIESATDGDGGGGKFLKVYRSKKPPRWARLSRIVMSMEWHGAPINGRKIMNG